MKFNNFNLDSRLLNLIEKSDLDNAFPIQKMAIPQILNRKDVLGIAPTGSGKTYAYLFPIFNYILKTKVNHNYPIILIVVPTRELVTQLEDVIKPYARELQINYVGITRGKNLNKLNNQLKDMVDIVIGTPGKLIQFMSEFDLHLEKISIVVLDEVDRLLDMGFQYDIERIFAKLPYAKQRQTLLFAATMPKKVEVIARALQNSTTLVDVGRAVFPRQLKHQIYETDKNTKFEALISILKNKQIKRVLIFASSQSSARVLARFLLQQGLDVEEIHAGLTQRQRNRAIANFIDGEVDVLVSTDIAARGLDIPDISHVISMNVPRQFEDYVHRAGRTARANKPGVSIIIASPNEFANIKNIEHRIGYKIERIHRLKIDKPKKNIRRKRK